MRVGFLGFQGENSYCSRVGLHRHGCGFTGTCPTRDVSDTASRVVQLCTLAVFKHSEHMIRPSHKTYSEDWEAMACLY